MGEMWDLHLSPPASVQGCDSKLWLTKITAACWLPFPGDNRPVQNKTVPCKADPLPRVKVKWRVNKDWLSSPEQCYDRKKKTNKDKKKKCPRKKQEEIPGRKAQL